MTKRKSSRKELAPTKKLFHEKVFKDSVHGYIRIPNDIVEGVVDTSLFQRLKNVEQTVMDIVFPSATHNRFAHSLGVFHLGTMALNELKKNIGNLGKDFKVSDSFWDIYSLCFQLACLLHDCGHSPYSHSLESCYKVAYEPYSPTTVAERLLEVFPKLGYKKSSREYHAVEGWLVSIDKDCPASPHELMSALLVFEEYNEAIQEIISSRGIADKADIDFIIRAIIGFEYPLNAELDVRERRERGIKNCLVSLLNSSQFDVDTLDYVVRDSLSSGLNNFSIDIERLLTSLSVARIGHFEKKRLNRMTDVGSCYVLSGELLATKKHSVLVAGKLKGKLDAYQVCKAELGGSLDIEGVFSVNENFMFDGAGTSELIANNVHTSQLDDTKGKTHQITARGICDKNRLKIGTAPAIELKKHSDVEIVTLESTDKITFSTGAYFNGNLQGELTAKVLENNDYKDGFKLSPDYVSISIAFNSNCLSVIEDVIKARNREYQWAISHQKIAYFSNYLLPESLRLSARQATLNQYNLDGGDYVADSYPGRRDSIYAILSWNTMLEKAEKNYYEIDGTCFHRPDNPSITSFLEKYYNSISRKKLRRTKLSMQEKECFEILEEFFERKYKKAIWKSYGEYRIYWRRYASYLTNIYSNIGKITRISESGPSDYGVFDRKLQQKFRKFGFDKVVWVDATAKLKALDPYNTFIRFGNGKCYPFMHVSKDMEYLIPSNERWFYFYYQPISGVERDDEAFRRCIVDLFGRDPADSIKELKLE